MNKPEKYRWLAVNAGFRCPQIKIQIQPLYWGLGIGWGSHKIALTLGPVSVALWFRVYGLEARATNHPMRNI